MDIRNKKQLIIDAYVSNPTIDLAKFAEDNYIHPSHVSRVIREFKDFLEVSYEIGIAKSMDIEKPFTYYLFSGDEEKVLEVDDGIIKNDVLLTDYERSWLQLNKGFI